MATVSCDRYYNFNRQVNVSRSFDFSECEKVMRQRSLHLDNFKEFARSLMTIVEDLSIEHHYLRMFLLESRICTADELRDSLELVKKAPGVQHAAHQQFASTLAVLNDLVQAAILEAHLEGVCPGIGNKARVV